MKRLSLITAAFIITMTTASCFSGVEVKTDTTESQTETAQNNTDGTMQNENTAQTAGSTISRKWEYRFEMKDAANIQKFDEAVNLADAALSAPGEFDDASEHYGEWYLVRYQVQRGLQGMDQMAPPRRVVMVNLNQKKVIHEISEAAPLFIHAVESIEDISKVSMSLIRRLAAAACAVTRGHDRYLEYPEPTLTRDGDATVLTYIVPARNLGAPDDNCSVKIYKDRVEYNVTVNP